MSAVFATGGLPVVPQGARQELGAHRRVGREGSHESVRGPEPEPGHEADGQQQRGSHLPARPAGARGPLRGAEADAHRLGREHGQERHRHQDRRQDDGRELAGRGRGREKAGEAEPAPGRSAQDGLEGHDREEVEERHGHVGGHEAAVGQDVRRENREQAREDGGRQAEARSGPQEDGSAQARAESDHGKPSPQKQAVRVVPAVEEALAELPLAPSRPSLVVGLEGHVAQEEKRRGSQQLHERRVLGIQAMVAGDEVAVARGQVGAFVVGGSALPKAAHGEADVEGQAEPQHERLDPRLHGTSAARRPRARATTSQARLAKRAAPVPIAHTMPEPGNGPAASNSTPGARNK